ncbi:MAG: hypothetical protein GWP61_17825 [Chloroflexi bacterium]|jgi:hypothetical protein|nr:hypothetical protein [Chloroflexota bacterium]
MTMNKVLERKNVPQESKWNSKAVFASWDDWQAVRNIRWIYLSWLAWI